MEREKRKRSPRSRAWCFTLNNPSAGCLSEVSEACSYICAGSEVAPSTGTPHLQGFVYFKDGKSFSSVLSLLPGAHIEVMRGTFQEAIDYCKKDGDYHEEGLRPLDQVEKGKKGKEYWDEQLALAKSGQIERCDSRLQLTHWSTLNSIAARYSPSPPSRDDLLNEWIFGPTGVGKSSGVRKLYPDLYPKPCNKWWDKEYRDDQVVLLEDMDRSHACLLHHLKIWADHYPFSAEFKGGSRIIRPARLVVTSNFSIQEIWPDPVDHGPLLRRFKVTHVTVKLL